MRKRILSLVLAVLMLASTLSITVFAQDYGLSWDRNTNFAEGDTVLVRRKKDLPGAGSGLKWTQQEDKRVLTCTKEVHSHKDAGCTWDWRHGRYSCGKRSHSHDYFCYTTYQKWELVKDTDPVEENSKKVYVAILDGQKDDVFPNEPTQSSFDYYFVQSDYSLSYKTAREFLADRTDVIDAAAFRGDSRYKKVTEANGDRTVEGVFDGAGLTLSELSYIKGTLKNLNETTIIEKWLNAKNRSTENAADYRLLVYVIKNEQGSAANTPGWHIDCKVIKKTDVVLNYVENLPVDATTRNYTAMPDNVTAAKGTSKTIAGISASAGTTASFVGTDGYTYLFKGWNTEADGTGASHAAGEEITLTESMTLYAQWEKQIETCNVTFEFVSGTTGMNLPTEVTSQQPKAQIVEKGETIAPSAEFDDVIDSKNDGTWTFQEWEPSSKTIVENTVFTGTWVFTENPLVDPTVTKTAQVQRYEKKANGDVDWSEPAPLVDDEKVKLGDKIWYTITVKNNNTNKEIPAELTITDTFNGTGTLQPDEAATGFTLSQNAETGVYTIQLNNAIAANGQAEIKLFYVVQLGDTVLGDGDTVKYLTNVATVGNNSTDPVVIPVDTEHFNLVVFKTWGDDAYQGSLPNFTLTLYKNSEEVKQETVTNADTIHKVLFKDLLLADIDKYSVKETAIAGATFKGTEDVAFPGEEAAKARDLFETNDGTGKWYATYDDTITANGIIKISNRYFKNPIVVTKEVAKIMRGSDELTDKTSARAGDVIHYTITITNNALRSQTIKFLDQLNTTGSLTFTGDHSSEITSTVPGSYGADGITIDAGATITLHAEYTVQAGDGQQVDGKDGYYVTNTITVYCGGAEYKASVSTKIEKDADLYKIYVPIIKTLKNEGTDKFDGERFAFKLYVTGQNDATYDWPSAHISIDPVVAGGSAKNNNEATEGGKPSTVISLTQTDFNNLPTDETTGLPYIWISETPGSNSRVTYDSRTYKLYLVPEKNSGSLLALLTDEAAALPSNHVYDPAETHTYYAIADLTEWKKDNSTPYDCAAAFVNYYGKQEHRDDTILIIPQLNRDDHVAYIMGYPDGNVRPEGKITRAEACTIFFRLLTESSRDYYFSRTNNYTDVTAGDWYNNAISTLSNAGIVMGYNDGTFRPNQPITRGEMAKIIANFANLRKGTKSFTDLSGHWSKTYVELAAGNGWITGYPDGSFRPDQKITRAETVTMINRVLERVPAKESRLLSRSIMLTFPDNNPGDWYYIAIQEASNSHEYQRSVYETAGDETWIKLIENVDWTKLER